MKKFLQLTLLSLLTVVQISLAQERQIKGKVTDGSNGSAAPGVAVKVKGTTRGTVTDAEGNYRINADANSTLVFSSVGFTTTEKAVGSATELNVSLAQSAENLNEVVVTALGISKEQKVLSYATQQINTRTFSQAKDLNVANSLAGRVVGLDIARSSSGIGGSTRIVLRGDRSISGNNQALIVVDGVPVNNTNSSSGNIFGGRDGGDGISSINPDDIESMNILRGASATALYGSNAANGAILINTKKGITQKGYGVTINSSFQAEQALNLRKFQNEYGQGSAGVYNKLSETSWGPRMDGRQVEAWQNPALGLPATYSFLPQPNTYNDFYGTGSQISNSVSFSGGSEKMQTYFSYTNVGATGLVDNNKLQRNTLNLRISNKISEKISIDSKLTYLSENIDNRGTLGEVYQNVNRHVARMPRNISLEAAQQFEYTDSQGRNKQNFWNPGSNGGQNPYWIKNRTTSTDTRDRITGLSALTYQVTEAFSIIARGSIDKYVDKYEGKFFTDTYTIAPNGDYRTAWTENTSVNYDLLGLYKKRINKDLALDALVGGNYQNFEILNQNSTTGGLNRDNLFITTNARAPQNNRRVDGSRKQGVFATADVTFKDALTVSLSARNDWSSTLPEANRSYFYPSAGFSAILSNLFEMPASVSFAKFRGSYAVTGNDAQAYLINQTYTFSAGGDNGFITRDALKPFPDLKPEITNSLEFGLEAKFLKGRLGFDLGYYSSDSKNQLFRVSIPPASGWSQEYVNAGLVRNSGVELTINFNPINMNDFRWDVDLNYAKNVNKLVELTPDLKSYDIPNGNDFMNSVRAIEGRPLGEVFSRGYQRNEAGQILVSDKGVPKITSGYTVYLGNTRPDWIGGLNNRFTYKNLSLSFLISARMGGIVTSFTNAVLYGDGVTEETLAGRDSFVFEGIVETVKDSPSPTAGQPNRVPISAEQYWSAVGGRNTPAGEVFTYSASNIRLRELTFGYTLPTGLLKKSPFQSVTLSLVGRNLFFIMNNAKGFDPEMTAGSQNTSVGLEGFSTPPTRTIGLNLNLKF
jgi:TonB-linked SusC/RagA family outer membrane protein